MFLVTVVVYFFGLSFVAISIGLSLGLSLERLREKRVLAARKFPEREGDAAFPLVSVIVPVHNEASRMGPLLRSLALQDYAALEFVFIDDRSSDEGPSLLAAFAREHPATEIVSLGENPGKNRKQYALARGIEKAKGELFLFTDGDCEVPPSWVSGMVRRMRDERVGVIIGPVFKKPAGENFLQSYQCFDHAVRYLYLAGAVGLSAAGGGFGNNLALRRSALEAVGGYDAIPSSPTEDAALVSLVRARSKYRIRAASAADVHVFTAGESSWRNFISQTLRWNNGGLFSPDFTTRLNYNYIMLAITLGILSLPFLAVFPLLRVLSLSVYAVITINTLTVAAYFRRSLPASRFFWIPELIFTPLYFALMTVMGYLGIKPRWKESAL